MKFEKKIIQSYGLLSVNSFYCKPETEEQISECVAYAKQNNLSVCAYGSGMSFSDVCLMRDNISLDISGLNRIIKFDAENGILIAQAGVLTTDILSLIMPQGWYLCGLSGSLRNTLAGDIGNNVHGKDSWKYGNFGANVKAMKICLADGNIHEISLSQSPELFCAVIGGMGLLGIIVEVTLKLIKIPSYIIENKSERLPNLNSLLKKMETLNENEATFFYAWGDTFSQGDSLGRSISETACFIETEKNISHEKFRSGLIEKNKIGFLPPAVFWKLFGAIESQMFFRAANSAKFYLTRHEKIRRIVFPQYQYPMVKHLPQWNLKYVPDGFHEMQILFSADQYESAFTEMMEVCRQYHRLPNLCGIRKHKEEMFYLSYAATGYSFTINYALKGLTLQELQKFNRKLVDAILKYNGKLNLGKFPYISPTDCKQMYPAYDKFLEIKNKFDANRVFFSDAALRLFS